MYLISGSNHLGIKRVLYTVHHAENSNEAVNAKKNIHVSR